MSYIVCSNSTFDNEQLTGISSPNSFQNHFKSPLEIEPNSEVAVESVKINRKDEFDITPNDEFYVYFGEELTTSILSGSATTNGVKVDVAPGTYSRKQLAFALQTALNKAPINPAFAGNCSVALQQDGSLEYDGFEFTFTGRDTTTDLAAVIEETQVVEANSYSVKFNIDNAPTEAFSYDKTNGSFTCNASTTGNVFAGNYFRSQSAGRFQTKPLANCSGVFSVDITNASVNGSMGSFMIGLSRPTTTYYNNAYPSYINNGEQNNDKYRRHAFCDYWITYGGASDDGPATKLDKLQVWQWGKDNADRGWNIKEVKYYEDSGNTFTSVIDATKINASSLNHIIWQLDGNELKLFISQTTSISAGKTFALVDSSATTSGADTEYNFAPMGNTEEYLSPVFALRQENQVLKINTYDAFDLPLYSFPTTKTTTLTASNYPINNQLIAGKDWWSNAEITERGRDELRFNELRPSTLWYGNANAPASYRYKNTNASGIIDYSVVIIPNQELYDTNVSQYSQQLYVIPTGFTNPNMGRILGFSTFSQIKQSVYGTPASAPWKSTTLKSINAGEFAVSSCFVRVNDLTFSSFNGAKSSRSQILYHIPRFTNDGKQYGELYFNAPEKTYIKLNNTDKLMLNNIKIDIVNRNESVVSDLDGATIVCLHVRPTRK